MYGPSRTPHLSCMILFLYASSLVMITAIISTEVQTSILRWVRSVKLAHKRACRRPSSHQMYRQINYENSDEAQTSFPYSKSVEVILVSNIAFTSLNYYRIRQRQRRGTVRNSGLRLQILRPHLPPTFLSAAAQLLLCCDAVRWESSALPESCRLSDCNQSEQQHYAVMSASLPGSRDLPASRHDLNTYWGRVKHSADISDPR
nr:putative mitochondrial transport protein fsf1 [Quercus suber]